jgi:hypothetical protein
MDELIAENQQLKKQLADEKQQLADEKQQRADENKKADESTMQLVQSICLQSPWRHLQLGDHTPASESGASSAHSPSPSKSPIMNKLKRKAFRKKCDRKCQIIRCLTSEILMFAHIVPKKDAAKNLESWGIDFLTNSDKTLLLLVGSLEKKFDRGDFCLLLKSVPDTTDEALAVKLLNRSIREDTIQGCELKFKDIEDKFLDVRLNVPSHRCIAKHSYYSIAAAARKGWIELQEFHDLIAQINEQSPDQRKINRLQEWLRSQSEGSPIACVQCR